MNDHVAEQEHADYRGSLGRYALFGEIAAGGMATVHLGRLLGTAGFARTVAIKRLHPHLAKDPDFVQMFLEEARLAARVKHPNVVATLDVVSMEGELFLVMEYVAGESLSRLVRKTREAGERIEPRFISGIICNTLDGLHAAHEAKSEKGAPLGIVHRDVSPQNVHVGVDGVARVLDFGIAKATNRVQETRTDQIKGKVAYMSPEQLAKGQIDRRADVYSASVVLWEALTGQRLFKADDVPSLVYAIVHEDVRKPSEVAPDLPKALDEIVMRGLERDADKRWSSALEMATALEKLLPPAPPREIGAWVEATGGEALQWRSELVAEIESETSMSMPPAMPVSLRVDSPGPIDLRSGVVGTPGVEIVAGPPSSGSSRPASIIETEPLETLVLESQPSQNIATAAPALDDQAATQREPGAPGARRRPSRAPLVAAIVLVVLGIGLGAARWLQMEAAERAVVTPPVVAPASSEEGVIVIGAARATTGASPTPHTTAPKRVEPKAPVTPTPSAADNDCASPFIVDSRGIRRPKPHCFKR
ncbi:MAG: protein kinase [Myxococcales bacterium]|nr:protein kinase [Myxococcales bacterium]